MGLPADREQYIHRLGRTGRKGKEGEGLLLLAPWEEFFLSTIRDLPITKAPVPSLDPDTQKQASLNIFIKLLHLVCCIVTLLSDFFFCQAIVNRIRIVKLFLIGNSYALTSE